MFIQWWKKFWIPPSISERKKVFFKIDNFSTIFFADKEAKKFCFVVLRCQIRFEFLWSLFKGISFRWHKFYPTDISPTNVCTANICPIRHLCHQRISIIKKKHFFTMDGWTVGCKERWTDGQIGRWDRIRGQGAKPSYRKWK